MKPEIYKSQDKSKEEQNQIFSIKKSHRKQLSQASDLSQKITSLNDDQYVKKRGFSSQYLNLTKRFKVKLVPHNSINRNINFGKVARLRIKTEQDNKSKAEQLKQILKKKSLLTPIQFIQIQNKQHSSRSQEFASQSIKTKNISFFKKSRYSPFIEQINRNQNKIKINSLRKNQGSVQRDSLISTRIQKLMNLDSFQIVQQSETFTHIFTAIPHIKTIFQLYQLSRSEVKTQKNVCKKLKQYVFSQQKQNYSISYFDNIFKSHAEKQNIRTFIYYERITFICFIDLLSHAKLANLLQQAKIILEIILGTYLHFLSKFLQTKLVNQQQKLSSQIQNTIKLLQQGHIIKKSSMRQVISSMAHRCFSLFRYNKQLYAELSSIMSQSKKITINRCFYDILCLYAIYLTDHEQLIANNYGLINYFATCPSPYLLSKCKKKYSLVVDLDQTLLYSKMKNGKYTTIYRPGALQFIEELSANYEIIIFTSAIKEYANQVIKPFKGISHVLYRHHVTRLKGSILKDLSRLGRPLNFTLLIDDLQTNFKLQPQNGIKVTQWKGDSHDKQLFVLKDLLKQMGKQNHEDLRVVVQKWKFQSNNI